MSLAESRSLAAAAAAAAAAAESGSGEADEPLRALTEALPPRRRLKMDGSDAERDVALHGGARLDDCDDGMPPGDDEDEADGTRSSDVLEWVAVDEEVVVDVEDVEKDDDDEKEDDEKVVVDEEVEEEEDFSLERSRSQKRWNLERGLGLHASDGNVALRLWCDTCRLLTTGSGVLRRTIID